jgi:hypothetical protein
MIEPPAALFPDSELPAPELRRYPVTLTLSVPLGPDGEVDAIGLAMAVDELAAGLSGGSVVAVFTAAFVEVAVTVQAIGQAQALLAATEAVQP